MGKKYSSDDTIKITVKRKKIRKTRVGGVKGRHGSKEGCDQKRRKREMKMWLLTMSGPCHHNQRVQTPEWKWMNLGANGETLNRLRFEPMILCLRSERNKRYTNLPSFARIKLISPLFFSINHHRRQSVRFLQRKLYAHFRVGDGSVGKYTF